ncbi:DUF3784 domain-containing protein [Clostridium perfringens]|nr:DUF3784 domain-containing protein [Clostridium perfringens]
MNVGMIACLTLGIFFLIFSICFAILKEKGAILVSGFNSFSKAEREKYDQKRISLDMRNSFFLWAMILFIGALFSYFVSQYCAIIAFIICLILFFKDVHISATKAFEKYKL